MVEDINGEGNDGRMRVPTIRKDELLEWRENRWKKRGAGRFREIPVVVSNKVKEMDKDKNEEG